MTAVRLDPFQTIVNVHWNVGRCAVLRFEDTYAGASGAPSPIVVQCPQLVPPLPIPEIAYLLGQYHDDTEVPGGVKTITTEQYHYEVSFSHPPDSGTGSGDNLFVVSDGTTSTWFVGTAGGSGGIAEAQEYFLTHGWDTFAATLISSSSADEEQPPSHEGTDRVVWFFDLQLIRLALAPVTTFQVNVTTPNNPGGPTESSPATFDWTMVFGTYKARASSFPLTALAEPNNWKAVAIDSETVNGDGSVTMHFTIDLDALAIGVA
jgi:hypothetical protein